MQHSIIPPSGAGRWSYCFASIMAQQGLPDTDHPHRVVGERVHDIGFQILTKVVYTSQVGDTGEMIHRALIYTNYVNSIRGGDPHFEERVDIPRVHPKCFGTPDYWEYLLRQNVLTIVDYKDGYRVVSPVENKQLITYYAGILDRLPPGVENTMTVRFVIIQPRAYGETIKIWTVKATELRGIVNQLSHAAHEAMKPEPLLTPGTHCKDCLAMFTCSANTTTVNNLACTALYTPELPINDMATELEFLRHAQDMVKHRLSAVEARIFSSIGRGEKVKGFEIGTGRGSLKLKDDITGLDDLAGMFGIKIKKESYLTPIQMKDAGLPEEIMKSYTVYYKGKQILRKIDMNALKNAFKQR